MTLVERDGITSEWPDGEWTVIAGALSLDGRVSLLEARCADDGR